MHPFDIQYDRLALWRALGQSCEDAAPDLAKLRKCVDQLTELECFWAYPGPEVLSRLARYLATPSVSLARHLIKNVLETLEDNRYKTRLFLPYVSNLSLLDKPELLEHSRLEGENSPFHPGEKKPYFEVLIVHPMVADYEPMYRQALTALKTNHDEFLYDLVFVDTAEAAITAILANPSIQSVVILGGVPWQNSTQNLWITSAIAFLEESERLTSLDQNPLLGLSQALRYLRPELDQFFISEVLPTELDPDCQSCFDRVLFHIHPFADLHFYILNGIRNRFSTPFFHALQAYSRRPKGVFHALPISRGHSLQDSPWIKDLVTFYGPNVFLAETSSTQGGLDSLLDPKGAIKQAHDEAARTFGAMRSFFVTNGTSTANKIVMQATLGPSDVVLVSSDCHKSIPYAVMLCGATPIFLEPYCLDQYDLYGAVSLQKIKTVLLELKAKGELHRVKQITLTNSTFDGIIYHVERFMMEILAIKPDIIFHWDEAWFAFAHFNPLYRGRTAMSVAKQLQVRFADPNYRVFYQNWAKDFKARAKQSPQVWNDERLYPDPQAARVRVYATQSTHKTLTAFRQGSMLHVYDEDFDPDQFWDAYRIHTSTSPNYQILASLDVGRRQVALEGYERVKQTLYLSHYLRQKLQTSDILRPYFKVLDHQELVPQAIGSELQPHHRSESAYTAYFQSWKNCEFVIDPTRVTVDIRGTGMEGGSFRELLINRYDIQVNKTSRNTVLLIINIGSTQESVDYLVQVFHEIAERLNETGLPQTPEPGMLVSLPKTRRFHPSFRPFELDHCEVTCLRSSYYEAFQDNVVTYVQLDSQILKDVLNDKKWISASFVTPYPPGVPVLVPGQIITYEILLYLQSVKNKEIHGYKPHDGLKVFKEAYIAQLC